MQLALRTARTFWLKRTVRWSAVRPAPAPAGGPHWCHGFCQRDNNQNDIITLYRTTSAKTRATAKLRQHAHTAERYQQALQQQSRKSMENNEQPIHKTAHLQTALPIPQPKFAKELFSCHYTV